MRGIDYSPRGSQVNRNPATGIRYGIISQHALASWFYDELEYVYDPGCPDCGTELQDSFDADESPCPACGAEILDGEQFGDEPSAMVFDLDGVRGFLDSMGGRMGYGLPLLHARHVLLPLCARSGFAGFPLCGRRAGVLLPR